MSDTRKSVAPRQTAAQLRARIQDLEEVSESWARTAGDLERDLTVAKHRERDLLRENERLAEIVRTTAAKHVIVVGLGGTGVACRECGMMAPCSTRRDLLGDKANEGLRVDDYRHKGRS
jgi:hypothetical protein